MKHTVDLPCVLPLHDSKIEPCSTVFTFFKLKMWRKNKWCRKITGRKDLLWQAWWKPENHDPILPIHLGLQEKSELDPKKKIPAVAPFGTTGLGPMIRLPVSDMTTPVDRNESIQNQSLWRWLYREWERIQENRHGSSSRYWPMPGGRGRCKSRWEPLNEGVHVIRAKFVTCV